MKHTSARHSWLLTLAAVGMVTVLQAACSEETGDDPSGGGGGTTSTSTTTTTTTTTSTTTGTGGTAVIPCDGEYSEVPAGECDLLQQDCPPGLGCVPIDSGTSTACVSGNGLKGKGDPCSQGECMVGLECVLDKCAPVCCPDNDQPCEGGLCNVMSNVGTQADPVIVRYCSFLEVCELFDPSHCDNGTLNCYPLSNKGYAVCVGQVDGVGEGEDCGSLNNCGDNMACIGTGVCRYACLLDNWESLQPNEGGCPVDQQCNGANFGIDNVGVCQPV